MSPVSPTGRYTPIAAGVYSAAVMHPTMPTPTPAPQPAPTPVTPPIHHPTPIIEHAPTVKTTPMLTMPTPIYVPSITPQPRIITPPVYTPPVVRVNEVIAHSPAVREVEENIAKVTQPTPIPTPTPPLTSPHIVTPPIAAVRTPMPVSQPVGRINEVIEHTVSRITPPTPPLPSPPHPTPVTSPTPPTPTPILETPPRVLYVGRNEVVVNNPLTGGVRVIQYPISTPPHVERLPIERLPTPTPSPPVQHVITPPIAATAPPNNPTPRFIVFQPRNLPANMPRVYTPPIAAVRMPTGLLAQLPRSNFAPRFINIRGGAFNPMRGLIIQGALPPTGGFNIEAVWMPIRGVRGSVNVAVPQPGRIIQVFEHGVNAVKNTLRQAARVHPPPPSLPGT